MSATYPSANATRDEAMLRRDVLSESASAASGPTHANSTSTVPIDSATRVYAPAIAMPKSASGALIGRAITPLAHAYPATKCTTASAMNAADELADTTR